MFNIGPSELIMIFAVVVIVIGPNKLPKVGKALGRTMGEFNKIKNDLTSILKVDEGPKYKS